jgi:choline dehydrogenase
LKLCLRLSQTEPLASHFIREDKDADFDHQRHMASDEELRELVKERVETVYHPTSTCRMAPRDLNGVVDSKLRVYGVDGLRVCDASFFPYIVSGHTVSGVASVPTYEINGKRLNRLELYLHLQKSWRT